VQLHGFHDIAGPHVHKDSALRDGDFVKLTVSTEGAMRLDTPQRDGKPVPFTKGRPGVAYKKPGPRKISVDPPRDQPPTPRKHSDGVHSAVVSHRWPYSWAPATPGSHRSSDPTRSPVAPPLSRTTRLPYCATTVPFTAPPRARRLPAQLVPRIIPHKDGVFRGERRFQEVFTPGVGLPPNAEWGNDYHVVIKQPTADRRSLWDDRHHLTDDRMDMPSRLKDMEDPHQEELFAWNPQPLSPREPRLTMLSARKPPHMLAGSPKAPAFSHWTAVTAEPETSGIFGSSLLLDTDATMDFHLSDDEN